MLAACLAAGATPLAAVAAVADELRAPLGARLRVAVTRAELGEDAAAALEQLAVEPALERVAGVLARATRTGAPVAAVVARLAADARAVEAARLQHAARQVGVRAALPLGLCFLPAFVLVGVVPTVIGLAGRMA